MGRRPALAMQRPAFGGMATDAWPWVLVAEAEGLWAAHCGAAAVLLICPLLGRRTLGGSRPLCTYLAARLNEPEDRPGHSPLLALAAWQTMPALTAMNLPPSGAQVFRWRMFQEFQMIGSVSVKLGRRVYSATLEYDSLIGRGLRGVRRRLETQPGSPFGEVPAFAIAQTIEDVTVEVDAPGYAIGDMVLEVTPTRLRLRAAGRHGRPGTIGRPFDLSVDLPEPVDPDEVTATLEDGVLTARMVKAAWVRGEARRVPVREASIPPEQATHESGQAHA